MEHSLEAYLQRLPTEKLEAFLEDYLKKRLEENFDHVIGEVIQEIARRKEKDTAQ